MRNQTYNHTEGRMTPGAALGATVAALAVAAVLTSGRLLAIAERQPAGDERDRWVSAAERLNALAHLARLDAPSELVQPTDDALAARPNPSPTASSPVAAPPAPPTTLPPTTIPPTTTAVPRTTTPPTTTPTTSTTEAPTPSTLPLSPNRRPINETSPLLVWAGGDSLGEYVGQEMTADYASDPLVSTQLDYHVSTGIARPDYFDWLDRFDSVLSEARPDIMVFMVGGNDDQPLVGDDATLATLSPEWDQEYARRAALLMDASGRVGTDLVWILLPPVRDDRRSAIHDEINRVVTEAAATRDWVSIYDPAPLLTSQDGGVDRYLTGPDGKLHLARAGDGLHITRVASGWIADGVGGLIETRWGASFPAD